VNDIGAVVIDGGKIDPTGILVLILIEVLNQVVSVLVVLSAEIGTQVKLPLVLIIVVIGMGICDF
jgi:hypothetical protein